MSAPPSPSAELAFDLRAALGPIYRRLVAEKTLPVGQTRALNTLVSGGATTSSALAVTEGITPQSMAAIVAELEDRGFVAREQDPADGRRRLVSITETGRAALEADRHATGTWLASVITDALDDGERASLAGALPILRKLGAHRG